MPLDFNSVTCVSINAANERNNHTIRIIVAYLREKNVVVRYLYYNITVQISCTLLLSMKHMRKERHALLIWSLAAAGHCGLCNTRCTNMAPRVPIESEIHTLWDQTSLCIHADAAKICVDIPRIFVSSLCSSFAETLFNVRIIQFFLFLRL